MIKSVFVKELKKYTYDALKQLFKCNDDDVFAGVLKKLKEYGILKSNNTNDYNLEELQYEDEVVEEASENIDDIYYVFKYVGVVVVDGILIKCYPKYININDNPTTELKQVLKVIEKYSQKDLNIKMYNESLDGVSFNYLAIALYLINDFAEYGIYRNDKDIIETNGMGSIIWDRTINDTFMLINNNKPYYLDLQTRKHINDDYDFFTRLHRIILTKVSKDFESCGVLELFDLMPIDLTDEEIDDLGDLDYISYLIIKELNVEFITRKQNLLKLFYIVLNKKNSINDIDSISTYGTQSFHSIWEKVCAEIFDNKLHTRLKDIDKDIKCADKNKRLIDIIEKPKWTYTDNYSSKTLVPDTIIIHNDTKNTYFIILDAKYYRPILEKGKIPQYQPGIESITKQFMYQLAYIDLIKYNNYVVKNIFVFPTEENEIIDKSSVKMDMFNNGNLKLEPILVKFIPAKEAFDMYLQNKKYNINNILRD